MDCPLRPSELRVMRMLCDGFEVPEIARRLGVSEKTVYNHAGAARAALGVRTTVAAGAMVVREGWHTQNRADDLGRDAVMSAWSRMYVQEFDRFLRGPVACRDGARTRSALALLGLGKRARWRETDRLPGRLAHVLSLTLPGVYYHLKHEHGAAWSTPYRRRRGCA